MLYTVLMSLQVYYLPIFPDQSDLSRGTCVSIQAFISSGYLHGVLLFQVPASWGYSHALHSSLLVVSTMGIWIPGLCSKSLLMLTHQPDINLLETGPFCSCLSQQHSSRILLWPWLTGLVNLSSTLFSSSEGIFQHWIYFPHLSLHIFLLKIIL